MSVSTQWASKLDSIDPMQLILHLGKFLIQWKEPTRLCSFFLVSNFAF
jgi:hypothetical protein